MGRAVAGAQNTALSGYLTTCLGIVVVAFVAYFFWALDSPRLHRDFYYVFVFLPFLYVVFTRPFARSALVSSKIFRLTLLFSSVSLVTTLFAVSENHVEHAYDAVRYIVLFVSFVALIAMLSKDDELFTFRLIWGIALSSGVSAIFFSGQYFIEHGGFVIADRMNPGLTHANNPIPMAELYVFGALAGLVSALWCRTRWTSSLFLLLVAASLVPVFLSQSRGPLLGLSATFLFFVFYWQGWKAAVLVGAAFLGIGSLLLFADFGYRDLTDSRNVEIRLDLFWQTLTEARNKFFIGRGWTESLAVTDSWGTERAHSHNTFLSVLLMGGVIGIAVFLWLFVKSFVGVLRKQGQSVSAHFASLTFFLFLVVSLVETRWIYCSPDRGWLLFWLPVGLAVGVELCQKTRRLRSG